MSVDILDRRLLFVTGKGGTGKTSVTAALSLLASQRGRKVLACEVEPRGDLAEFFESAPAGFKPREVQPGLFAMAMSTEESLQEYLRIQLRLPALARMGPLARAFDFVATAAPGVREILTVGKLAYEARERHYDLVVADAAASGHIVGQLSAPRAIDELVHVGPVHDQTGWMLDILGDPAVTGLVVVTTPEEMPVNETIGLVARLRAETNVEVSAIVVNRVLPELFSRGDEEVFERLRTPALAATLAEVAGTPSGHEAATPFGHEAATPFGHEAGGPVDTVLDAARLAVTLRRTRAGHLDRLRESIPAEIPLLFVPYLFTRGHGLRTTAQASDALSAELGY